MFKQNVLLAQNGIEQYVYPLLTPAAVSILQNCLALIWTGNVCMSPSELSFRMSETRKIGNVWLFAHNIYKHIQNTYIKTFKQLTIGQIRSTDTFSPIICVIIIFCQIFPRYKNVPWEVTQIITTGQTPVELLALQYHNHCTRNISSIYFSLFIYEIDLDVLLWRPFRWTICKMEDSNKETSLKAFLKDGFPFRLTFTLIVFFAQSIHVLKEAIIDYCPMC